MKNPSPCTKECPDRSAECMVACERYLAYRKQRDAGYAAREKRCDNLMKTCGGEANARSVYADARRGRRHWK